jgi:MATE family multidrug resistance protein
MAAAAVAFLALPVQLAGIYSFDPAVIGLAAMLLPIAGLFQVFDGLQVVAMGLLRGLGDTRVPMIISIIAFWCVGMPVSLVLAFVVDLGAIGLWWGFVVALGAVAIILLFRLKRMEGRRLRRIVIDELDAATL